MSIEAMAVVLHHSRAHGTAKLVLVGIANHDGDGGAWPSLRTLKTYANCDERTVRRALRHLEDLGELKSEPYAGGRREMPYYERPSLYHVLVTCPPDCDRSKNHRPVDNGHPGDASVPTLGTPVSPPLGTPVSPEPSLEPPQKLLASVRAQLQDARARGRKAP